ncbi:MAG: glycine zipper 2TM domain-containing protein [Gammaproteobacteria bacterium]
MNTSLTRQVKYLGILGLFTLAACNGRPIASAADDTFDRNTGRVVDARDSSGRLCIECGTVREITPVSRDSGTTGVGAVVGAIVGGVAGRQVGGGTGRDIATVAGAVGGAVVGNEVEQRRNNDDDTVYDVRVRMEDGSERVVTVADAGALDVGGPVTVNGNDITIR